MARWECQGKTEQTYPEDLWFHVAQSSRCPFKLLKPHKKALTIADTFGRRLFLVLWPQHASTSILGTRVGAVVHSNSIASVGKAVHGDPLVSVGKYEALKASEITTFPTSPTPLSAWLPGVKARLSYLHARQVVALHNVCYRSGSHGSAQSTRPSLSYGVVIAVPGPDDPPPPPPHDMVSPRRCQQSRGCGRSRSRSSYLSSFLTPQSCHPRNCRYVWLLVLSSRFKVPRVTRMGPPGVTILLTVITFGLSFGEKCQQSQRKGFPGSRSL